MHEFAGRENCGSKSNEIILSRIAEELPTQILPGYRRLIEEKIIKPTLSGGSTTSYGTLSLLVRPSVTKTSTSGAWGRSPPSAVKSSSFALIRALSVKVLPRSLFVSSKILLTIRGSCLSSSLNFVRIVALMLYTINPRCDPPGAMFMLFTSANAKSLDFWNSALPTLLVASRITARSSVRVHGVGPGKKLWILHQITG